MYDILTLNKIAACGLNEFSDKYNVSDTNENPDAIVLRSFNMLESELGQNLKAVARAGAGVNNVPVDRCSEKGIVVFNTPGANANGVKELVLAGLLLSSRKVVEGIEWAKTLIGEGDNVAKLVEKGKGQFGGQEIKGKKLAVIGLGAIGVMVANAAYGLDMDVVGFDLAISVKSALNLTRFVKVVGSLNEAIDGADYISLHLPLTKDTEGGINEQTFALMKDNVRILNFARGELVDTAALKAAIASGKVASYVTDFPNEEVLKMDKVIAVPHLGASTEESEDNCAIMAVKQVVDFIENGNIVNSVNFPECVMPRTSSIRMAIAHKNIPNMINQFAKLFSDAGLNIDNFINKSKGEFAYTLIDAESIGETALEKVKEIEGVLSVRVIK